MKKCYKCKQNKDIEEFSKNKRYKDGLNDICKQCKKEQNISNHKQIKEYRDSKKEYHKEYYILWKQINPDLYRKNYSQNNKNKTKKEIQENNKKQIEKGYKKEWSINKYKNDPQYKLSQILRIRMLSSFKNKENKSVSVVTLLGCSVDECKQHLESQFKPEMTWENHGEIWEIDHIIPCSKFDLTDIEQQKQCFHYTNLQPLFKTSGIAKNLGYIYERGNRNKSNN